MIIKSINAVYGIRLQENNAKQIKYSEGQLERLGNGDLSLEEVCFSARNMSKRIPVCTTLLPKLPLPPPS